MNFKYPKKEKLCNKTVIDKLFNEGKPIYENPLKLLWIATKLYEEIPVQSTHNVSKKRFKRAVKRNLLKRRMREAFRLNKHQLYQITELKNIQIALIVLYNSSSISDFATIELAMKKALDTLCDKINQKF